MDSLLETCAICRNNLNDECIECQANNDPDIQCAVVRGECNHVYHNHCILRWLVTRSCCPLDNSDWVVSQTIQIADYSPTPPEKDK